MDAFWTAEEGAFRGAVRDLLRRDGQAAPLPSPRTLPERAAIVEEAARHEPRFGRELAREALDAAAPDGVAEAILDRAWLAGAAAHVLLAGTLAARERGDFASSLMGCRDVQDRLAGLASAAELLRLGTCRLCRLVERGERGRAGTESAHLREAARALGVDVRAVALSLLGPAWTDANLPADGPIATEERTLP
jgi:hypothetical protein